MKAKPRELCRVAELSWRSRLASAPSRGNLLEAAGSNRVQSFVFTSTTSTFGDALTPAHGAPAAWITEEVVLMPKNIYGTTKVAAEDLCQLFHRNQQLPCLVPRTSRFFPEEDGVVERRAGFGDAKLKVNELLYRRVDIEDVVSALLLAVQKAPALGFGKLIIDLARAVGSKGYHG